MNIGYARVSTKEQNLNLQVDSLKEAGCEMVFEEKISGAKSERPELNRMLDQLRKGDVVMIWKLDRLGRSLKDLVSLVDAIKEKGAGLKSLNDPIDTTTPTGTLIFHLFASLAEFERSIISQRTKAGLESARARGRFGGRPKGLSSKAQDQARLAETLYKEQRSISEICKHVGISKATLYRYLRYRNVEIGSYQKKTST